MADGSHIRADGRLTGAVHGRWQDCGDRSEGPRGVQKAMVAEGGVGSWWNPDSGCPTVGAYGFSVTGNREDSVSVDVAWVSKHAMERYRLHFPEAVATDVMAAIELSITLPTHLADALAGRRRRTAPVEGEERLLHPAGTGVFVPVRFVKTPTKCT